VSKYALSATASKEQAIINLAHTTHHTPHHGTCTTAHTRRFRNQLKIDIREYYEKDGELLPGRKGISLNEQQCAHLTSH
jgi:hypothetical protein